MKWLLLIAAIAYGQEPSVFQLTEANLVSELTNSPETDRLLASYYGREAGYRLRDDPFNLALTGSWSFEENRQAPLAGAFPPVSKQTRYSLGLERPFRRGFSMGLALSGEEQTSRMIVNGASSRAAFTLGVDLLRNFMGRVGDASVSAGEFDFEAAKIRRRIDEKALELRARDLYWQYVAARESKRTADRLLKSAEQQIGLTERRRRSGVADAGDIARFKSQQDERQAQVYSFKGQMLTVEVDIKTLLPQLMSARIKLGERSLEDEVEKLFTCADTIAAKGPEAMDWTLIDDIVRLKEKTLAEDMRRLSAYSLPELGLDLSGGVVGAAVGRNKAEEAVFSNGKGFYSAGISVSLPIEGKRRRSRDAQLRQAQAEFNRDTRGELARISALHRVFAENASLLKQIIIARRSNDGHLETALKDSRAKYVQARLTAQNLLQEEDSYFANSLETISTELQLVQLLFQYFSLFTETPCPLNEVPA